MLPDEYKEGSLLHRWRLVAGHPRCIEDGVDCCHPDADATRARNDRVREAVSLVLAYEAAQRLVGQVEAGDLPAETVTVPVVDGVEDQPNPAWGAYQDALALVAGADATTLALALLRATGEPPAERLDDGSDNPDRAEWDVAVEMMEAINEGR